MSHQIDNLTPHGVKIVTHIISFPSPMFKIFPPILYKKKKIFPPISTVPNTLKLTFISRLRSQDNESKYFCYLLSGFLFFMGFESRT